MTEEKKWLLIRADMVEYGEAWELQKKLLHARMSEEIEDSLMLLQHPPTFTYGRRYKDDNLIKNKKFYEEMGFAVHKTDRGGLATYHCPGQLVGYPIIHMKDYTSDYYCYLRMLEESMINVLNGYGLRGKRREGYTGVWTDGAKVGFIGVRIAFGYTMHGFSLNVNNDLRPFYYITPCGIQNVRITSLCELLRREVIWDELIALFVNSFRSVFHIQTVPVEIDSVRSL